MKYIEKYLKDIIKVKPLGTLTTKEDELDGISGEMVYIGGKCSNIFISRIDYANWLEKQVPIDEEKVLIGARKDIALSIMNFLDRCTTGMCLSNMECADLESAVVDSDWSKVYDYMKKKLDKQGKQKSLDYENINIQQKDFAPKSAMEAAKEKKIDNANKVEPRFHEGEWITDGCLHCKISDVLDDRYIVDTKFGKRSAIPFKRENNYHLWSIQDAKDGDILIYNDSIFIFDEIYENDLIYYGIYEHNKFHNDKYYSFLDLNTININNIYPATKEQRDTLEKAMTDAGYTFDFEKKELKKLGQSEVTKTSDQEEIAEIPFGAKDSELQEATYFIPKGFYAEIDDDKVVIKKGEKPATWSEEDELSCFESALFTAFSDAWQSYLLGEEVNVKRWAKEQSKELLEAAKEELKGHNSAWSEEDEKRIFRIKLSLQKDMMAHKHSGCDIADLQNCEDWLMNLYESHRVQPQPKQEWSERDKEEFQIAIDTLVEAGQHDPAHWLKSLKQRIGG